MKFFLATAKVRECEMSSQMREGSDRHGVRRKSGLEQALATHAVFAIRPSSACWNSHEALDSCRKIARNLTSPTTKLSGFSLDSWREESGAVLVFAGIYGEKSQGLGVGDRGDKRRAGVDAVVTELFSSLPQYRQAD